MFVDTSVHLRLLGVYLPSGLLLTLQGCVVGWAAVSAKKLMELNSTDINPHHGTYFAFAYEVGRLTMAIPGGVLGDIVGRKPVIVISSLLQLFQWAAIGLTKSTPVILCLRYIGGVASVFSVAIIFTYAAEISPPKIRGTILSILESNYTLGILIEYALGALLPYDFINYTTAVIALITALSSYFLVESPHFLVSRSKHEDAKHSLKWLNPHSKDEELNEELAKLQSFVSVSKKINWTEMFSRKNNKCLGVVVTIDVLTQLTGSAAVLLHVYSIFDELNIPKDVFVVTFAFLQYVGSIFGSVILDLIGRRSLYIASCSLCVLSHGCSAIICCTVTGDLHTWLMLVTVSSYACVYASSIGVLTAVIRGELFPQEIKGLGNGLSGISSSVSAMITVILYNFLAQYAGLMYCFVVFAITSFTLLVFVYFELPETMRKSLEEIQHQLGMNPKSVKREDHLKADSMQDIKF